MAVIALMAIAWLIVALLEWTAWLDEPHYGRGLPPRFYVPQVALPPPRAVEQFAPYPLILEPGEETTFVTAVSEWATALEDWPAVSGAAVDEETQIAIPEREPGPGFDEEPVPEPLPQPRIALRPPTTLPPLPELPALEPEPPLDEPPLAPPPLEQPAAPRPLDPLAEPREPRAEPAKRRLAPVERSALTTLHHIDPLSSSGRRRFFRRAAEAAVVEVPDGPPPGRRLPRRAPRTSGESEP